MSKKNLLILIAFIGITHLFSAQALDKSKYNQEKENALNFVINSPQFDSIYSAKRVYFSENELLLKSNTLTLKKNWRKVKVLDDSTLTRRGLDYINIGDFTMLGENPTKARVQFYSSMTNKNLNVMLKKENGKWIFENYLIMDN